MLVNKQDVGYYLFRGILITGSILIGNKEKYFVPLDAPSARALRDWRPDLKKSAIARIEKTFSKAAAMRKKMREAARKTAPTWLERCEIANRGSEHVAFPDGSTLRFRVTNPSTGRGRIETKLNGERVKIYGRIREDDKFHADDDSMDIYRAVYEQRSPATEEKPIRARKPRNDNVASGSIAA